MKLACLIPAVFAAPPFSLADFAAMQKQPNQIGIEPFLNGLDPAIDQMPLIQMLVGSNNKNEDTDVSAEVAGTNTIVKANVSKNTSIKHEIKETKIDVLISDRNAKTIGSMARTISLS